MLDESLHFDKHISSVIGSSFYQLRLLSKIKPFLNPKTLEMAVHAYITSCLDYCSSLYCGSSKSLIDRLQLVQNAAARFLHNSHKSTHITPILRILHWLPIQFRIDFKILLFVYKSLHDLAPIYLSELLHQWVSATFFDGSIGFSSRVVEFACLYLIHIFLFFFLLSTVFYFFHT